MISLLISRLVIVVFGFLYPAFSSYKAIKTKDIRLYVKWMMYWIVFALFMSLETFTDIFFSFWFPFYYELKIILVFWLLSPVTRGSSIMYRRVIHPLFMRREQEIDELIARAKDQGYNVILEFGCKGVSLATNAIMTTAVKGSSGLLFQLRKSYSLNDLMNTEVMDRVNEIKLQSKNEHNRINVAMPLTKSDTTMFVEDDAKKLDRRTIIRSSPSACDNIAVEQNGIASTLQTDVKNGKTPRLKKLEESKPTAPSSNIRPFYSRKSFLNSSYSSIPVHQIRESVVRSPTESNKIISNRSKFEFAAQQSSEIPAKFSVFNSESALLPKTTPRKAVSTPDLSFKGEKFWLQIGDQSKKLRRVDECSPNDSAKGEDSSPSVRRRRRRKRTAPKPPEAWQSEKITNSSKGSEIDQAGAEVPLIRVDESKMASNVRPRNFDDRYLNPPPRRQSESSKYSKLKPQSSASKLRHFLSKSRELLTHWRSGEQTDSHSDYAAASSDDSYSTTSSRCNSTIL